MSIGRLVLPIPHPIPHSVSIGSKCGEKVQEAMAKAGMTYTEVAKKTGLNTSSVWGIVNYPSRIPKVSSLLKLSRLFGVNLDYFLGRDNTRNKQQVTETEVRTEMTSRKKSTTKSGDEKYRSMIQGRVNAILEYYTIADLAEMSGMSQASVSQYRNGKQIPSFPTICRMAKSVNVSTEYFAGYGPADLNEYHNHEEDYYNPYGGI